MFDWIRTHQRIALLVLLLLILPAFVFFGMSRFDPVRGDEALATVDGEPITRREFDLAQRQQIDNLRQMFGDQIDVRMFDTPAARQQTLEQLIMRRVVEREAATRGLLVTDERVREEILGIEGLRKPDGGFDSERYRALLSAQNLSPQMFEQQLRRDLQVQTLPEAIQSSVIVPTAVRDRLIALQQQRREVRAKRFEPAQFVDQVKPAEEQLREYYRNNIAAFETPESIDVEYLVLSRDALAKSIEVAEADARTFYEQNASRFGTPEQRRASHILVKKGAEAKAKAERLLAQLREDPARFEQLAKEHSEDPGSAGQGGDLGFFSREMMVKPFADAAFGLKPNEVSGLVESEFGYHIIRLDEVKPGAKQPFEKVRDEIVAQIREQLAAQRYAQAAENFSNLVYEQPDSLKPAAERFKLDVLRHEGLTRAGAPSLPRNAPLNQQRLIQQLFTEEALRNKRNTDALEVAPSTLVSARVLQHRPAQRPEYEQVAERVRERYVAEQARELARKAGEEQLKALREGAKPEGFGDPVQIGREGGDTVPPQAVEAIFRLPAEPVPAYTGVDLGAGGYGVYALQKVIPASPEEIEKQRDAYAQQIARANAQQELSSFIESLKARAKITRNLDLLRDERSPQ